MLTIPSIAGRISEVENFLQNAVSNCNISPDRYPDMLISLTEAVNNAIIHGNKEDEKKLVIIQMIQKNKHLKITVTDEGGGFNLEEVPDPTAPENIECCGGRGVYIMSRLADRITFQNNGSTVEMHFQI
ncbi:MAG: ATP-binding protein [Saprospiraceae bacterium]|nr:ATP-binding protein [Saprospiraceae bacterium]